MSYPPLFAIVGPTASGKSELALRIALTEQAEIISADSALVYRQMDVGTAKPSLLHRQYVNHHLIDILNLNQLYSAGEFVRNAQSCLLDIQRRGHAAIICGGTGLYVRSLLEGIVDVPPISPAILKKVELFFNKYGASHCYEIIANNSGQPHFEPNDSQRIKRALAVLWATGKPLASYQTHRYNQKNSNSINAKTMAVLWPREELYHRINQRVITMIDCGFKAEVEGLLDQGYSPNLPALRIIGYREMIECIKGEITLDEAISIIQQRSRHYAKRQITWFSKYNNVEWVAFDNINRIIDAGHEWLQNSSRTNEKI